jgi:hypothetical protein
MYDRFAANLSLENAVAAYRDCRAARARARCTKKHRDLGALEQALLRRIKFLPLVELT